MEWLYILMVSKAFAWAIRAVLLLGLMAYSPAGCS